MKKICIDCRLYSQTGVGRYIRAILSELEKHAFQEKDKEYFLIVYKTDTKLFTKYPANLKIISTSAKWHSVREQIIIPYILYKNKIDIVHFPYFNAPIFYLGRFIVTIHDLTINKFKTGKATSLPKLLYWAKKLFYYLTIWFAVKRAEKILTVSDTVKNEIAKMYGIDEEKIIVVYNGGELECDSHVEAHHDASLQKKQYILYVGNLHPHKNLETLVLAYEELAKEKEFKNIKLVIVSGFDFFYQKLFKFIQSLNLETKIDFTGLIPNAKLREYYQNATCLVFPSLSEGFGIPGVEAMNLGCPVVASDIPVFHEIYGDAAIFFNPKNAVDLKNKIMKLLENEELRQKMILSGMVQASNYSWEKMGAEILNIYNTVCYHDLDHDSKRAT